MQKATINMMVEVITRDATVKANTVFGRFKFNLILLTLANNCHIIKIYLTDIIILSNEAVNSAA